MDMRPRCFRGIEKELIIFPFGIKYGCSEGKPDKVFYPFHSFLGPKWNSENDAK